MRSLERIHTALLLLLLAGVSSCKDEMVVVVPVAVVEVQGPTTLTAGNTSRYTAIPKDDDGNTLTGRAVTWSVSNGSLASVDSDGRVTGILGGEVTVSARSEGRTGSLGVEVRNPMPRVDETIPDLVRAGSEDFELTVLGNGFVPPSVIRWNGNERETTFVNPGELRALIPAEDITATGVVQVTVENPGPGGGTSGERPLTVGNPIPAVTSLSPDHHTMTTVPIVGANITVRGEGFVPGSVVKWEGEEQPTTYHGPTELNALLPGDVYFAPGWKMVTVTNPSPGGGTSEPEAFGVRIPVEGPFVTAGLEHTCALTSSGKAYCWGRNDSGQLGDGTRDHTTEPQGVYSLSRGRQAWRPAPGGPNRSPVAGGHVFVAVTAGNRHTCALDPVGKAYCWGNGNSGELGDDGGSDQLEPVPVAGELHFVSIESGERHTCGLTHEGRMYCWGNNSDGQIGDGSGVHRWAPAPVSQGDVVFTAMTTGQRHSCGAAANGHLYCWGWNHYGQLGDGSEDSRQVPTPVSGFVDAAGMTAGQGQTCAWNDLGEAYCWGYGGTLGAGSWTNSPIPVPVSGSHEFSALRAGPYHVCGITGTGELLCWGNGYDGQLGTGGLQNHLEPEPVPGLPKAADVGPGYRHTCALTSSGELFCWGEEGWGQLGNGDVSYRTQPTPVEGGPGTFSRITTGLEHSCGLGDTGQAWCWGYGSAGQLGDGTYDDTSLPVQVGTAMTFQEISAGGFHTCSITPAGEGHCWGGNYYGQLGNGSAGSTSTTPVPVSGGHSFRNLRTGIYHNCGVTDSGDVLCWGRNNFGQLGDGSTIDRDVPVPIDAPPGKSFRFVSLGSFHSCARTTDGEVWCWGRNDYGQLGDGTFGDRTTPVEVSDLPSGASFISAGAYHTCALDDEGRAFCWGNRYSYRLGGSHSDHQNTPQEVQTDLRFRSIHASYEWTCARTASGEGFCWGSHYSGQLGTGDTPGYSSPDPLLIAGGHEWADLSEGIAQRHTCGTTTGDDAYCWGWQHHGALGIGRFGLQLSPVRVGSGLPFGPPVLPTSPGSAAEAGTREGRAGIRLDGFLGPSPRTTRSGAGPFRIERDGPLPWPLLERELLPRCPSEEPWVEGCTPFPPVSSTSAPGPGPGPRPKR